jgi:PAS domain S-box-containing protein
MFQNPDEFIEVVNYCLKHNNQIISRKLTMKNGKILECNFIPIIAHSNQSIGQLWKVQDVTSRHLAQRKISESEEKYRGIIENMELALMEVDNNHKILKVYDRFCDMIGYTESELIDKNARDVFLPPDYEKVIHEQDQLRADGKRSVFEMQMRKKDGDLIWVLIGGSPIFDQNGKTVGSIGIHYYITDRKKLEEELEEARIQAEKARMAEQQFLANMSHEIRNPLNSIIGISNLLYDTNPTLEQLKHLDNVKRSSDILLGLISGILDISQIESGNLVLVEKEIDIADIVSGLIQIVSFNAKEKNIKFESNLFEKKNFRVVADPTVINQIFLNLLNNAIKFTKQGSIKVDGQFVEDIENKCRYQFTVSDTGIGIPKEDILTIFESFKQAGKNTKLKYGGTGLGLSIVKKLVSLYQGTINVESTVNKGTTFKFDLKLQKSKSPSAKKIKLEFTSTGNSHLLIVEDNKINQQYLSGILNKWNIQSHYANNGLEALDYLDKNQYSLILMDIRMPEMDGYETTIRLRSDHFNVNKDVPIIALTASALVDEREKALSTGMNYHLTKPFTPDDLAYALANFGIITEKNAPNNLEFVFSDDLDGKYLLEFYQKDIERASVMFELFLKVIDDEFEKLRSLLKTKSWNEFSSQVHKIKPNFNIVGLTELAKIMKEYEGARDQSNIRNKVESTFSKTEEKLSEGKSHVKNELVRMQKFQKS